MGSFTAGADCVTVPFTTDVRPSTTETRVLRRLTCSTMLHVDKRVNIIVRQARAKKFRKESFFYAPLHYRCRPAALRSPLRLIVLIAVKLIHDLLRDDLLDDVFKRDDADRPACLARVLADE